MNRNFSNISTVLFDLDDTLLNTKDAQYNAICYFKSLYDSFNNVENDSFSKIWHQITEKCYDRYLSGELTFEEMRIDRMKKLFSNYGNEISDDEAHKRFDLYVKIYEQSWILFDDTLDILNYLKSKYKLAIITNGDSEQQRAKIKKTGLYYFFDDILISSEVGCSKPDKKIYEIVCDHFNVAPNECVMIGDRYEVDIKGAINAEMHTIWINRRKSNIDFKYQISELTELKNFL